MSAALVPCFRLRDRFVQPCAGNRGKAGVSPALPKNGDQRP